MTEPRAEQQRDAFVESLFGSTIGMMEILTVYLGDRLGLYRALADPGPARGPPSSRLARARTSATRASGWSSRPWRAS